MMLYTLQDKLNLLIKKHKALKENETALQKKVVALELKVSALQHNIQQLEEALMAKGLGENDNQNALKQYIDAIIEEIDLTIKKL